MSQDQIDSPTNQDPGTGPGPDEPVEDRGKAGASAPSHRPLHLIRRTLRLLFGLGIQFVLLVVLLVLLVLGTQTGLRTAIAIAQELAPGLFQVGLVQGRVLGRLHLGDVRIHNPDLNLVLGSLDLDWSPLAALTGTLRIRQLAARDIDLEIAPSKEEEKTPLVLPDVVLPLRLEIDEVLVERLRLSEPGAQKPLFLLDRAALSARMSGSELDLTRLEVDLPEPKLEARASGQAKLLEHYPLLLDLQWALALEPKVALQGNGRIGGDLKRLVIEHEITGSAQVLLDAHVQNVLDRPSWEGEVQLKGLDLADFSADAPSIDLTGRLETKGDLDQAGVTGIVEGKAPDLPDFGHLKVALDLLWADQVASIRALDLTEAVSGAKFTATGRLDLKAQPGTFEVKGDWEKLRWPLSGDILGESPEGKLNVKGTFEDFDYHLLASANGPDVPALDLALTGTGNQSSTHLDSLELKTLDGVITASGDLSWAPELIWDLQVRGRDLNPSALAPGMDDQIGLSLDSKGGLQGFGYDLGVTTKGPGLPPARLALGGKGDLKGTQLDNLRLDALDGYLEGHATLGWDPKVSWVAELVASGINPGSYAPQWPGHIGGRLSSEGSLEPDGPRLDALIDSVKGELRGYPVAVGGQVRMAGQSIQIDGFKASSGPSAVQVDGSIAGETLNLGFDLISPDLQSLVPGAKGSIQAKGQVAGTFKAPQVKLDLSAKDAEMAGQGIESLTGKVDVSLTPEGPFELHLDGKDLFVGGMLFNTLSLHGDGGMPDHRVSLSLNGQQLSAQLEAKGALGSEGAYQGSLTRLELDNTPVGNWRLQRPMPIKLDGAQIAAGPLCIRDTAGSGGCLGFDQSQAGTWTATIDLDPLSFKLLDGLLPPNLVADGAAKVKGRFQAQGPILTGNAEAQIPQGQVRVVMGAGQEQVLDFSSTRLTLDADAQGIGAKLGLPVKGLGEVAGKLDLPGWRLDDPGRATQPLRGSIQARVEGFDRISEMFPDVTGVTGGINADLVLEGTLGAPGIRGTAGVRGLGAQVPLIGLVVSGLDVNVNAGSQRLDIQGQGDVGGGRLEMSGNFLQGPSGLAGKLHVGGQRLKVANTKEYFALVSPAFEIRLSPKELKVTGEVVIPEARIRPRSLPAGTVSPSSDVVMEDKASDEKPALPVDINVQVKFGDDVTIDAFGVRGRITGAIRAFQRPGRPMLGDGQLAIVDGIYRMSGGFGLAAEIGAPLVIEQGRLIYAKSPIDNPGLLLQAQREGGDTTAGVRVMGTIRNPKLAFFSDSDPDMTQAEITKYLLTGVPPSKGGGTADSSLAVGTYVAPKLYMEYESGMNDQADSVKMRYSLTPNIELQTETGDNPGGDIFYKFEH